MYNENNEEYYSWLWLGIINLLHETRDYINSISNCIFAFICSFVPEVRKNIQKLMKL